MAKREKECRERKRLGVESAAGGQRDYFPVGSVALSRILALDKPEDLVGNIAHVGFYWVVKKVGEEDALPILQMASLEQWGFLLDLSFGKKTGWISVRRATG